MPALVGIDIGSRYTKVVEIEPKTKPCLIGASIFPTPLKTDSLSKKINIEEFKDLILSAIPLKRLQASRIGINLFPSSITLLTINLPKMSKKELATAAISEAKRKMIPPTSDNHTFEHLILREVIVAKIPRYEVLVVRTEKSCIREILQIFSAFEDVQPILISPTCYTILNLLFWHPEFREKSCAFIELGYESINISISRKATPFLYRNINYGLKDIISHISANIGLSLERTEEILREKGIPEIKFDIKDRVALAEEIMRQKYEASLKGTEEVNLLELRMLWQQVLERVTQEIRRSFVYYNEQSQGERVDLLFFFGGLSRIKGFVPNLIKNIGGSSEILNPFKDMNIALEKSQFEDITEEGSLFVSAVSSALSAPLAVKRQKMINFLPLELKIKAKVAIRQMVMVVLSISLILFFSLAWLNYFIANQTINTQLRNIESQLKILTPALKVSKELKERTERINQRSLQIEQIIKERLEVSNILKELASLVPESVLINEVTMGTASVIGELQGEQMPTFPTSESSFPQFEEAKYKMQIKASIFSDYETATEVVEEFRRALEESIYFKNVKVRPLKLEKITPLKKDPQQVSLTPKKLREFSLEAELVTEQ